MQGFYQDEQIDQPTLILEVKTISPKGLGGQKKSSFIVSLDNTQVLIAAYLRGISKFTTLRILKDDKSCIAEVHSWMIASFKAVTQINIEDGNNGHKIYTTPIILCAYNVLNNQTNFEHTIELLNMWLVRYKTLTFEFIFNEKIVNKDVNLFLHIKKNPLGLVKGLAKTITTSVGNKATAIANMWKKDSDF